MKKVLIISHFAQSLDEVGNDRFIEIAELLVNVGYQVEVISTDFSHKKKTLREVSEEDLKRLPYQFTMVHESGYPKNVCLQRFHSHYVFGQSLKKYLSQIEKPDLVYCAIPSLDAGNVAANYCKKNKIPFIVDIQDLWPEAFKLVFNIPIISDIIFAPMTWQANRIYAQADKVIAVSQTYRDRGLQVTKKDEEGLCVFLGTNLETFDSQAALHKIEKPEDELWIAYVGTLGHSYNIEIVIDALNRIADKLTKKVVFKVFGDGPYLERFQKYAENCRVQVDFLGRLEYSLMVANLVHCDIAVNPISKGAAQSIINKHADYCAAGLPVVSTQESPEYRNLIEEYAFGINCGVTNVEDVANALLELIENEEKRLQMGRNSRKLAEEKFDRKVSYEKIISTIKVFLEENEQSKQ